MISTSSSSVANKVLKLAKLHSVSAERDGLSTVAVAITRLADDIVELDNIEQLLVNLKRKGVLNKSEILKLQGSYLREKKLSDKKLVL